MRLTKRQRELVAHLVQGRSNKEIAYRMNISVGTVKAFLHTLYKVTETPNRTALALRFAPAQLELFRQGHER
jgi:two-component system, NarL family, nitrate/nitrite response regulator NarL